MAFALTSDSTSSGTQPRVIARTTRRVASRRSSTWISRRRRSISTCMDSLKRTPARITASVALAPASGHGERLDALGMAT
ncbi:hypothetical protein [Luteibacter sp. dw_328]|uniref:hypothetical protein n=1 Tax=Luteibacter sp. dw_328 TaxID=2719796 RepID=UPI001BD4D5E7|nr:hypothetical protein [Luteibacter sp. dw_328]